MSSDLYELAPASAEDFVVQWLSELGAAGVERPTSAELPYWMVTAINVINDPCMGSSVAVVSVHSFAADRNAADLAGRQSDARMNLLATEQSDVELFDGTVANAEYVTTLEAPTWRDYKVTTIQRYVARYEIGLEFVA